MYSLNKLSNILHSYTKAVLFINVLQGSTKQHLVNIDFLEANTYHNKSQKVSQINLSSKERKYFSLNETYCPLLFFLCIIRILELCELTIYFRNALIHTLFVFYNNLYTTMPFIQGNEHSIRYDCIGCIISKGSRSTFSILKA